MAENVPGVVVELERDRFVSLAENSPFFIGMCDSDLRVFFVNAAGKRLIGIEDRDVRELTVDQFFFPDDVEQITRDFLPRALATAGAEIEVRFRHFRTGVAIWMLYNVFALTGSHGEPIGYATVSRDITVDVAAREQLRTKSRRQALLVDLLAAQRESGDADSMMSAASETIGRELSAGRVGFFEMIDDDTMDFGTSWSGSLEPLTGTFAANGIGAGYLDQVRRGAILAFNDTSVEPLAAGSRFAEIGAIATIGVPLFRNGRWQGGLYLHCPEPRQWTPADVEFVRDIAEHTWDAVERARAQSALRASEQRFREAVDLMPEIVWVSRADGSLEYVNERWKEFSGLDLTASSDPANVSAIIHPDDRGELERQWSVSLATGEPVEVEVRVRGSHGDYRWFLARTVPLRDENGRVVRWFTASTDIETQKQAAAALQEIDRRKDDFLATLSHELRTPLTAGYGWVKLLRHSEDPALTEQGLQAIEQSFTTQIRLVDDLLDVSRIISGKLQIERQPTDLAEAVQTAVDIVRPAAHARGVELRVSMESIAIVEGDAARLTQVVWNLVSNAVKFTPAGGTVDVTLSCASGKAELTVRDTGSGIEPDFLPYVFDRFRQADSSISRRQGGLGLGLSIVASLVDSHGGDVIAASDGIGKGATFTVTLPLYEQMAIPAARFGDHSSHGEKIDGVRVLVVDDDDASRGVIRTILEGAGAVVRMASSAEEAVVALDGWRADVLVSDISMPIDDGYSLVSGLRRSGNDIPALAVTAQLRTESAARKAGFQGHLAKPFAPEELVAAVKALI